LYVCFGVQDSNDVVGVTYLSFFWVDSVLDESFYKRSWQRRESGFGYQTEALELFNARFEKVFNLYHDVLIGIASLVPFRYHQCNIVRQDLNSFLETWVLLELLNVGQCFLHFDILLFHHGNVIV
jgi:hypothetical protein